MKVAIYTISKNEIKHVERFMAHTKEADCVYIGDTGSTDGTQNALKNLGANVFDITIKPWRFDYARNTVLNLIPANIDWCVSVDLDELLVKGWRERLESSLAKTPNATRVNYMYTWSWKSPGVPDAKFRTNKFHSRFGYKWILPCHEVLSWTDLTKKEIEIETDIELEHHPDVHKSRAFYLELLELAAKEQPNDARSAFYLGREYYFHKNYDKAILECQRHLLLPTSKWDAERSASMRVIADCYKNKGNNKEQFKWLLKSCAECDYVREPWYDLALAMNEFKDFTGMYFATKKCLAITQRFYNYLSRSEPWSENIYGMAAVAAWRIGLKQEALMSAKQAYEMNPSNTYIKKIFQDIVEALRIKN